MITSGLYFYLYNELSTITIKKTSATTQSVANTAKVGLASCTCAHLFHLPSSKHHGSERLFYVPSQRVIVIVGVAIALGESLEFVKLLGCSIGIGGVLLYSLVK